MCVCYCLKFALSAGMCAISVTPGHRISNGNTSINELGKCAMGRTWNVGMDDYARLSKSHRDTNFNILVLRHGNAKLPNRHS